MKTVSLRHHLFGLGSAIVVFGVLALASRQATPSQERSIELTKFQDSLRDGADVTVVNSNLIDASRVAATRVLSKSARIGFIYASDAVCAGVRDDERLLKSIEVNSVKELEAPTYLFRGAAELGKTQSIGNTCLTDERRSRFLYSGSRELKKELLTNGVAPTYITVSDLK